jgi:hypothetical protein
MIMQKNPNLFREILSELYYPCEHTMRLLALAADMAAFEPDARPDMAEVARRLAEITAGGAYTHSMPEHTSCTCCHSLEILNPISVISR